MGLRLVRLFDAAGQVGVAVVVEALLVGLPVRGVPESALRDGRPLVVRVLELCLELRGLAVVRDDLPDFELEFHDVHSCVS